MSIEVKTPTKTQFEHSEFPCGDKTTLDSGRIRNSGQLHHVAETVPEAEASEGKDCLTDFTKKPLNQNQDYGRNQRQQQAPPPPKRRRYTISSARPSLQEQRKNEGQKKKFGKNNNHSHNGTGGRPRPFVLPNRFLMGGNINDPLNLESLCDEEVNRSMNESTPVNSPLPLPAHRQQQVQVLIPPNINDPLNLNSNETVDIELLSPKGSGKKKRHKSHKHKRKGSGPEGLELSKGQTDESEVKDPVTTPEGKPKDFTRPMTIDIVSETNTAATSGAINNNLENKLCRVVDKIVSPVVPQISPKRKRKRTTSDPVSGSTCRALLQDDSTSPDKSDKHFLPPKPKSRRQNSNSHNKQHPHHHPPAFKDKNKKFVYGNYSRYYGYRNPDSEEDIRLKYLLPEWFEGRDILDIGCNVGHVTISVAKTLRPHKVVGMDIDSNLIYAARRNIRHYLSLSSDKTRPERFPKSMQACFGMLAAPVMASSEAMPQFPENVSFVQGARPSKGSNDSKGTRVWGNYVLEADEFLDLVKEEYDIILGFSLTKWIHLNHGDEGLKRAFKRMFRQLRPGGKLILEPQPWASYKKRKNLTENINKHFNAIQFRPSHFTEYLMSKEVGFTTCETVDTPFHRSKGFRRPILVYTKPDTSVNTPFRSQNVTPLFAGGHSSRTSTPTPYYTAGGNTPTIGYYGLNTPTPYSSGMNTPYGASGFNTPKFIVGSGHATPNQEQLCSTSNASSPRIESVEETSVSIEQSTKSACEGGEPAGSASASKEEPTVPKERSKDADETLTSAVRLLSDIKSYSAPAILATTAKKSPTGDDVGLDNIASKPSAASPSE